MRYLHFRNLIGATHTEEQAKMIARQYEIKDGPNAEGEYFERKGKLFDKMPSPYPNDETARFANGGALPPDLSYITMARDQHEDYVFHLLTGYQEPPAGVQVRQGLYYNPYFDGGAIGMAPPLADGTIEYDDGTDNSQAQLAKDVSTFLAWAAEPESDERKRAGLKVLTAMSLIVAFGVYWKRLRWSVHKSRVVSWVK